MVVGVIEEFLQSIFEEKYVVDDREPLFNFTIPGYYDLDDGDERPIVFGLFPPSGGLWKQVVAVRGVCPRHNSILDPPVFLVSHPILSICLSLPLPLT